MIVVFQKNILLYVIYEWNIGGGLAFPVILVVSQIFVTIQRITIKLYKYN